MVTEQDIKNSTNNRTPVGLANWCWSASIGYVGYQAIAAEQGISPLKKSEFIQIQKWWDEQWNGRCNNQ